MNTDTKIADKNQFFTYKNRPLVRNGNTIYYGNMWEKYVIMMQIAETTQLKDMEIASKVSIQLLLTDPDVRARDRIVKRSEKSSLYDAIDISAIWLERALAGN